MHEWETKVGIINGNEGRLIRGGSGVIVMVMEVAVVLVVEAVEMVQVLLWMEQMEDQVVDLVEVAVFVVVQEIHLLLVRNLKVRTVEIRLE